MAFPFIPRSAAEVTVNNCDDVVAISYLPQHELVKLTNMRNLPRSFRYRVADELQARADNDRAELEHGVQ